MPSCGPVCEEFQCYNFTFNYDRRETFVEPSCSCLPKWFYPVYRLMISVVLLVLVVLHILYVVLMIKQPPWAWFIFITNWALLMALVMTILWAALVLYFRISSGAVPDAVKFFWWLYTCTMNLVCVLCLAFWIIQISQADFDDIKVTSPGVIMGAVHTLPLVWVGLELGFSNIPIRFVHFVYPLAVAMFLLLVNTLLLHFLRPLSPMYSVLTSLGSYPHLQWHGHLMAFFVVFFTIILVLMVHCILYVLCVFKFLVMGLFFDESSEVPPQKQSLLQSNTKSQSLDEKSQLSVPSRQFSVNAPSENTPLNPEANAPPPHYDSVINGH